MSPNYYNYDTAYEDDSYGYGSDDDSAVIEMVYLEYDGASKGNPGKAGAGVVLKAEDGTEITRVREGLGIETNNSAEYKALIRGLTTALEMGYFRIHVQGDSRLVCMQVLGHWQIKNGNLYQLCEEVRSLWSQFEEFSMSHVPRAQNADADYEANKGADLPDGQVLQYDNPNYMRRG